MPRQIIPYNPALKQLARQLRNNSTAAEIKLWQSIKAKKMRGYDFHRQKPIDNYILDFYCNELMLGIELNGSTHDWNEVIIKDEMKQQKMASLGISVLHFTNYEVMRDLNNVLVAIEGFIVDFESKHLR